MTTLKQVVALTFVLTPTLWAVVPTKTNSNYGIDSVSLGTTSFGAHLGEQTVCSSSPSGLDPCPPPFGTFTGEARYLFIYTSDLTNLDLTLVGSAIVNAGVLACDSTDNNGINEVAPCTDTSAPAFAGDFAFDSGGFPVNFLAGDITPIDANTVRFQIPGSAKGLALFIEEDSTGALPSVPQPTPEPSSLILLASAMLLVAGVGYRRLRTSPAVK